jgi:LEA14-like dessication related protein
MKIVVHRMLVAASVVALAACINMPGKVDPPSVTVSDVRMGTAGVLEQQYFVKLRIQNPNDTDLLVRGTSFELELNDKPFAKGVSPQSVTVPRFASEFVEVETVSGITSILRQLGGMTGGTGMESFRYRIKGKLVTSNAGTIPFDERGDLKLGEAAPAAK